MASYLPGIKIPVKTHVFEAMQSVDIETFERCSESELRPILPALVRMALCSPLDSSERGDRLRKATLKILSGMEVVNNIVGLLSIDFNALEQDVKKEQQLRAKTGGSHTESLLISQLPNGLALEFERSDAARRIRLILSQLLFVISELKEGKTGHHSLSDELFESPVYLEEVSDVLYIALAELPGLLALGDVAEALLCLPHGNELLCQLVANFPESFMEVCTSLVSHGQRIEEDSAGSCQRLEMLRMLAAMNPREALNIRALCVQHCTMPGLAVALSLQMSDTLQDVDDARDGDDVVTFLNSLLLGSHQGIRNWFSQFIKAAQKKPKESCGCVLHAMRQYLLKRLVAFIPKEGHPLAESAVIPASALIRLYAALKGLATLKYSDEEMAYLLQLLTCHPPLSSAGKYFVSLAVCMLIANPLLLSGMDEEQKMINWICWLMSTENTNSKEGSSTTLFGEILFLVALHFHSNQVSAILDLVCNTLGMKSIVKASSLTRLRHIFTQLIFTEQVVAANAVKLPVTKGLDASCSGYLPIHSILQLLKSRVFSRHKVPIKDWIYRQICESYLPLHPLLPQLVECFVSSIIPKGLKFEQTNQPVTEAEILAVYSDFVTGGNLGTLREDMQANRKRGLKTTRELEKAEEEKSLAPRLLMLYYVLLYQDTLLSVSKSPVLSLRQYTPYSETMMSQIPINYLVQQAQQRPHQCSGIFPPLLRLLVTHFPHLCLVEDWLEESLSTCGPNSWYQRSLSASSLQPTANVSAQSLHQALSCVRENPALMMQQLNTLLQMPAARLQQNMQHIVDCLPRLLGEGVPRKVLDTIQRLWFQLHSLSPRSLRLKTVNALQPQQPGLLKKETFTEQDVVVDPLVVLRCDQRVFRCPPILGVMLHVLSAYLQASGIYLQQQVSAISVANAAATVNTWEVTRVEKDRQELKSALIAAQESACLQILLEVCLPTPAEQESAQGEISCLREVQCAVFSFLHQAFIKDPYLAKLLHFQGYPSELLPLMVAGVPSMHICLDFIPELLGQPQVEKQVFGFQLLAALCAQYSLPKSMNVARLALNVMFTLLTAYESTTVCQMFAKTVPSLLTLCKVFPPLCNDVTSLLMQVARICRSQLAITSHPGVTDTHREEAPPKKLKLAGDEEIQIHSSNFHTLLALVQNTFRQITEIAVVTSRLY
ncbi:hypothetical protein C0Q70_06683 [Pomacea canaliculata]|uniref:Integrator complex subunit 2 n=1 Tax=Pomacea canaliculata TaxID=400727 RepID=A0A2T7PCY7_POMCA|nr:integrator complex subunit 2-like isoform X2 [Pomacea canaliculata]PVD31271.1 hypothetical protein C0Q70_06683 [Pomacea canaliculata]